MIQLTTPFSSITPAGLVAVPHATATSKSYDYLANAVSVTFSFGTATSSGGLTSAFAVAPSTPTILLSLNITPGNGNWTAVLGGVVIGQGALTTPQLAGAVTVYMGPATALRDAADYFAMGTFLLGTQTALWGAGDL